MTGDNFRKGIEETFDQMERSIAACSEDIVDHAINIGRHFSALEAKDLDRLFNLTGKYYRECECRKKR